MASKFFLFHPRNVGAERRATVLDRFVEGGVEEPMPLPRAYQGKISADGTHIAYRMNNSWDEERRNYRGGQNRPIWIVDLKTYDLVSPPWTDSKDVESCLGRRFRLLHLGSRRRRKRLGVSNEE